MDAATDAGSSLDAGSCGDAAMASVGVSEDAAGCIPCGDGAVIQVEVDADGRGKDFAITDPGSGNVCPIVRCVRDLLADRCYPSLANSVQPVASPDC